MVADKRDDLTRHDLDRFNTMIKEVEDLHKFGKFDFFLFSTEFIFIFEINLKLISTRKCDFVLLFL